VILSCVSSSIIYNIYETLGQEREVLRGEPQTLLAAPLLRLVDGLLPDLVHQRLLGLVTHFAVHALRQQLKVDHRRHERLLRLGVPAHVEVLVVDARLLLKQTHLQHVLHHLLHALRAVQREHLLRLDQRLVHVFAYQLEIYFLAPENELL